MKKHVETVVPEGLKSMRLDQFLAGLDDIASRGAAQRLIRGGNVWVNGEPALKPSVRVFPGAVVTYEPFKPETFQLVARSFPLEILYEDEAIIAVNKPPHRVVHPAPGHADDTLVNALLTYTPRLASLGRPNRPGIVHRLDKGTSGVLIVAKTDEAYLSLTRQFRERLVRKIYHALVYGQMDEEKGTIDHAIMRSARDRKKMTVVRVPGGGREAVTEWKIKKTYAGLSLLELSPRTGRTHQLRVHLATLGHPIVGDPVYGRRRFPTTGILAPLAKDVQKMGRQALHASRINFFHPVNQKKMTIKAPFPQDLKSLLQKLDELFTGKEETWNS